MPSVCSNVSDSGQGKGRQKEQREGGVNTGTGELPLMLSIDFVKSPSVLSICQARHKDEQSISQINKYNR